MKKLVLFLVLAAAIAAAAWYFLNREQPREVEFVRPRRLDIVSTLNTNGKVEPVGAAALRSDRDGKAVKLHIRRGDAVTAGQPAVTFDAFDVESEIPGAEAKVSQAEAELKVFDRGGSPAAFADLDAELAAARLRLQSARREQEVAERLAAKGAATRQEVTEARDRVRQASGEIEAIGRKRTSLVAPEGKQAAEARLREARAAVTALRSKAARVTLVVPASGSVYNLAVRPGAFLRAGDLIAEIGDTRRLQATILVDEPELGRVSKGMPVRLTWDARPLEAWEGTVERMPTQITPQGSRQVGEVLAMIDNSSERLPPGANVNVEIRTGSSPNALTIPRNAVRLEDGKVGAMVLEGDKVRWRALKLGEANVTDVAVVEGLGEGDAIAVATETPLRNGEKVQARFR